MARPNLLLPFGFLAVLSCRPAAPASPEFSRTSVAGASASAPAPASARAESDLACNFPTLEAICDHWLRRIQPNHREACGLDDCKAQVLAASLGLRVHELGVEFTWDGEGSEEPFAGQGTLRGGSHRGYADHDPAVEPACWGREVHGAERALLVLEREGRYWPLVQTARTWRSQASEETSVSDVRIEGPNRLSFRYRTLFRDDFHEGPSSGVVNGAVWFQVVDSTDTGPVLAGQLELEGTGTASIQPCDDCADRHCCEARIDYTRDLKRLNDTTFVAGRAAITPQALASSFDPNSPDESRPHFLGALQASWNVAGETRMTLEDCRRADCEPLCAFAEGAMVGIEP